MKLLSCKCAEKWSDVAPLVLRLAVGAVFIVHGYSKVVDVAAFEGMLTSLNVPLPGFFAWVVTLVELLGGIGLVLGFLTHWAAKLL
ncbi:MAG: DoxX family protein, partial [Patescibacteria group bacterium]